MPAPHSCLGPLALAALALAGGGRAAGAEGPPVKKVALIAGAARRGPGGHAKGIHEYEKSVRLLKHCLDTAPGLKGARTAAHFQGWPKGPRTLDDADTIVLSSDGADHPLLVGDRLKVIERRMRRGLADRPPPR
jgi:hypothetical protein